MGRLANFSVLSFAYCLLFGSIICQTSTDLKCDNVKQEFAKISSEDVVPDRPVLGMFTIRELVR